MHLEEGPSPEPPPDAQDPAEDPCADYDWESRCVSCDGFADEGDGCCLEDLEDYESCVSGSKSADDCADAGGWCDCGGYQDCCTAC